MSTILPALPLSSLALKSAVRTCLQKAGGTDQELKTTQEKSPTSLSTPVEYKADVAIIEGGGTGLVMAAVSALENGAKKVVILEKLGYLGGHQRFRWCLKCC